MYLLEKISHVAAAAHTPFIAGASPNLLDLDSFSQLGKPRDLAYVMEQQGYIKWRAFRQTEDARYIALVLPHVLARMPYGQFSTPVREFAFEERVDLSNDSNYVWGNAAFCLGVRLAAAFAKYGWTAAIRGVEGGGVVSGLPIFRYMSESHEIAVKCPTEIAITDRRERELAALGFIPLVHCKGTDFACFFSVQTCKKAELYDNEFVNAVSRASVQLPFVLAVSRFCHYLKAIMRDKTGAFTSRSDCEQYLNQWLSDYITSDNVASLATRARYPLKAGRVEVREGREFPGSYLAAVFLLPNFQLDSLNHPIRTVVRLKAAR